MAGIQPWERLDGEGEKRWQAFCVYRDLGADRSLVRVADTLGKSVKLMERWSKEDGWVARTESYDRNEDRQWHASQARSRKAMAERHVKVANALMNKVVKRLATINPDTLSPGELVKMFEAAAKVERLALEGPARLEITGKDGGPMSLEISLSDEERRARLEELQKELATRVGRLGTRPAPRVIDAEVVEPERLALAGADDG